MFVTIKFPLAHSFHEAHEVAKRIEGLHLNMNEHDLWKIADGTDFVITLPAARSISLLTELEHEGFLD